MVAGCTSPTVLDGRALSMLYDPNRAGGLPATDGPSGPRDNVGQPTGTVDNSDNGEIDRLALLAINDIEDFWKGNYSQSFDGSFKPISTLLSYDSKDPSSPVACGGQLYKLVNAFYCVSENLMAWDRNVLLGAAKKYFGEMSINGVLAHEYGHAIQRMANIADDSTPILVLEQQADCFSGTYMRWVAEGRSPRFTLSTTDGLDHVLAGAIELRDPTPTTQKPTTKNPHGTAFDRVGAFQIGFDGGPSACAKIDMDEIQQRRGNLPQTLQTTSEGTVESGQVEINNDTLSTLMELLGKIFNPTKPPALSTDAENCPDAQTSKAASYCPANNTIYVDMPTLQDMGKPADESQMVLLQGDNTAISVFTSRYAMAVQHERGLALDTPVAALRAACLTGVAQSKMAEPIALSSGKTLVLSAGDVDKAISGLLTNGLVASDTNGKKVPAGFTRIEAYRSGLLGEVDQCFQRFP
ncbi:MAG: neutral zinc metallopeptidase [Mycobacteriaceae bacterium]|nr:neutral zinc metallopeptidase [Mycobacteriaceae bacterium]